MTSHAVGGSGEGLLFSEFAQQLLVEAWTIGQGIVEKVSGAVGALALSTPENEFAVGGMVAAMSDKNRIEIPAEDPEEVKKRDGIKPETVRRRGAEAALNPNSTSEGRTRGKGHHDREK